ncbi:MAG: integrase core domain-containing protein, partial [bacterium]
SRKVLSWALSNTLDTRFCVLALKKAIQIAGCVPTIVNTDQGSQFTSEDWITPLKQKGIVISMDGRGRWLDNVVVERFWRTIKYEDIYLKSYETGRELEKGISAFINRYNTLRPHQSLNGNTPDQVYREMTWQAA